MADKMPIDKYMATVLDTIARCGWMVQGVFPGADDPEPAGKLFAYTVGLAQYDNHPEFIVFGLDPTDAQIVLNIIGKRVAAGERFGPGPIDIGGQHHPWALEVTEVEKAQHEYLTVAYRLFSPLTALQLVVPDPDGRYPWEEGFSYPFEAQPLLGQAPQ